MNSRAQTAPPQMGVWRLAWPAVLTNLLQSTVGLVGTKVVGGLGADALAAAVVGQRLLFVLQAMLTAISAGTTALVARAWGAGDREDAAQIVSSSLLFAVGIGLVATVLGALSAGPFATLFGLTGTVHSDSVIYMRVYCCFTLATAVTVVLGAGLRSAGDTHTPFMIGAVSNIVNVFLLYAFLGFGWGFPELGIVGAALAGGTAFSVGALIVLWMWLNQSLVIKFVRKIKLSGARMGELARIGYPAAIEQLVVQSGFIVFTVIISRFYGSQALSAYGIGSQILSFSFVIGFGFSIAASTLVGQHLGAKNTARAIQSGWRAMVLAIACMTGLSAVIVLFARPIAEMMISDAVTVDLTVEFIYLLGLVQPLMAIEYSLGGALRGVGDTRFPLLTTFTGLIVGRVVLAVAFAWAGLPVQWIYGTLIGDYVLKAIMLVHRFRSNKWQHVLTALRSAAA